MDRCMFYHRREDGDWRKNEGRDGVIKTAKSDGTVGRDMGTGDGRRKNEQHDGGCDGRERYLKEVVADGA